MPFFDEKYFYESFFNAIVANLLQKTLKNLLKSCFCRVKEILSYIYTKYSIGIEGIKGIIIATEILVIEL